jgi:hypothetical protein
VDEVERLEAAAATAHEEGEAVARAAAAAAAAAAGAAAAADVVALQSAIDALQVKLDGKQLLVDKQSRELAGQRGVAASLWQQRTIDGKVTSGIDTVAKVYTALHLKLDTNGMKFEEEFSEAVFRKDLFELADRRLRTVFGSLEPAIMAVLGAFHEDKEGLLQLFALHKRSSSSSAAQELGAQYAEMPMVGWDRLTVSKPELKARLVLIVSKPELKARLGHRLKLKCSEPLSNFAFQFNLRRYTMVMDAVDAYNRSTSVAEREQIMSTLVSTFTRDQLNNMDFDEAISRRRYHHASSHALAYGPGRVAPKSRVHRSRVKVSRFEEAFKILSDPENMQQVAFGTKVGQ